MKLPRRISAAVALAIACCLALAGLLGSSASAREGAVPSAAKVEIVEFVYGPGKTVGAKGGKVTFLNASKYTHTATNGKGKFDTGHIAPGRSATVRLKQPGVYPFHCEIHPFMTGKIVVK